MNETLSVISSRRSHRAYQAAPISREKLEALLRAGVESPSAVNRQPWHFSLVQNQALLDEINRATRGRVMAKSPDQRSPRFEDDAFHVFYHAPAVIFISGDPESVWTRIDCGIAVENIALAAESLGLGSVILGLPREAFQTEDAPAFRQALGFPEGWDFVIAIALGVPTDNKPAHPVGENKITWVD